VPLFFSKVLFIKGAACEDQGTQVGTASEAHGHVRTYRRRPLLLGLPSPVRPNPSGSTGEPGGALGGCSSIGRICAVLTIL
jgi:hypothetical protein